MQRTVQGWEMRGQDVVRKRMESFRLWNIVPLGLLLPDVIKALNGAYQLVQFCFVLAPWGGGVEWGQNLLWFLKGQWIIDQGLGEF